MHGRFSDVKHYQLTQLHCTSTTHIEQIPLYYYAVDAVCLWDTENVYSTWNDLEGQSTSLVMAQFSRQHISLSFSRLYPCVYLVWFLKYSMLNNGVPLKPGLQVIQGHWKGCHSIDHKLLPVSPPL